MLQDSLMLDRVLELVNRVYRSILFCFLEVYSASPDLPQLHVCTQHIVLVLDNGNLWCDVW